MTMVVSTAAFFGLFLLAMQASSLSTSFSDWLLDRSVLVLASGSVVLSVVACWLVLDAVPHISDEVAYLFQAGALAAGRLTQPTGPIPEAFDDPHLIWHGQWFGIMNPDGPLLLAAGVQTGVPWLVNPLVGGQRGVLVACRRRSARARGEVNRAAARRRRLPSFRTRHSRATPLTWRCSRPVRLDTFPGRQSRCHDRRISHDSAHSRSPSR
jgi:hypothetical protein